MRPNHPSTVWSRAHREGDCLLWDGTQNASGYGYMKIRQERVLAHRIAWMEAFGPIPDGLYVLHRCDVRRCINPAHLFLGTRGDNNADMKAKGRARNHAMYEPPTHCPQGHAYAEVGIRRRGKRECRECDRQRTRRYYRANATAITARLRAKRRSLYGDRILDGDAA